MNILQKIFSEHFHKLLNYNIKIRNTVIENVDKMIHCGDYKRGYAFYICEHCLTLWFLHSGAEVVFVPLAVTSTPENVPPLCLLSLFALLIDTVFLLFLKNTSR